MTNHTKGHEAVLAIEIDRWRNVGGAIIKIGKAEMDKIKVGRPMIIIALFLTSIAVLLVNFAFS
jgi:hypothetical protein